MTNPNVWVVIPAAGFGSRMQSELPKQYIPINNQTVLEHTVSQFENLSFIKGILIAISKKDTIFPTLSFSSNLSVQHCIGGAERYSSVLKVLKYFKNTILSDDWVMVHDAARPCVRQDDIKKLYKICKNHPVGGILACPVKDTLKQSTNQQSISNTVDRSNLWHALTPQMFRYKDLVNAIEQSIKDGLAITDDASAFENSALQPLLVDGREDNIKITRPADIQLAQWILEHA